MHRRPVNARARPQVAVPMNAGGQAPSCRKKLTKKISLGSGTDVKSLTTFSSESNPSERLFYIFTFPYIPMQDVAPSAVSTAEIIDANICSVHLIVSFLVIRF